MFLRLNELLFCNSLRREGGGSGGGGGVGEGLGLSGVELLRHSIRRKLDPSLAETTLSTFFVHNYKSLRSTSGIRPLR